MNETCKNSRMMTQHIHIFLLTGVLLLLSATVRAQNVAIKSNLLYDATATVNAGVEVGLSSRWTLDLSGNYNGWSHSHDRKWKHWLVQPEARYWLCNRFAGHFFALHAHGGQFNVGHLKNSLSLLGTDFSLLSDNRFQGWFLGGGIGYGYALPLGRHWNAEFELGIGYAYTRYDRFECAGCGKKMEKDKSHHYFGPTKAAISLVYLF